MALFHNIRSVARYEAKILRRSWFFRLFSIGSLFIFTMMNIGVFSPVGEEDWDLVSIPSSLPLINLYLLNIGQAIIVIFLASDFLKRDKKVDTNEVLYTRPMSNFEYILGKTLGILKLFIGLDMIILLIGLIINLISKRMTVDWMSYPEYLLIIPVPTIIFSLGLAFLLMSVIRNQAITFLILLGIAALDIFWLFHRMGSIFDYMAFGFPVFKSGLIGFDNPDRILNQRLLYLFLGLSLVMATILLFRRLPQSRLHTSLSVILMFVFFTGAVICGYNTYSFYEKELLAKELTVETNRQYENEEFVTLTDASVEFQQNNGSFSASAELKFINDNKYPLEKLLFSINPDLRVTKVATVNSEISFRQNRQIIEITPSPGLEPGQKDSLTIHYEGSIDESFCYPDYSGNIKENPYLIAMVRVNRRQAFLDKDFVLLTPETYWYPVPGLNYYPSNPARVKIDFTKYTLRVKPHDGLVPVSQGKMHNENGYFTFKPDSPLTGITLAIGNYQSDTLTVDSVTYLTYHFPGHDYYKADLSLLKDTLGLLVSGIMRDLETSFSTSYPFSQLSLVEVPIQFFSYPRMNTQTRAELQPSMVLLPEMLSTLRNAGFGKRFTQQKKRMARNNQVITDKELQVRIFNDFIRNTFISGEDFRFINGVAINEPVRYRLGPSFYFFKNNFSSSEYPVLNAVFESHLQKQVEPQSGFREITGGLSDNDRANLILRNSSFRNILAQNPKGDTLRIVLTLKGDYLFNLFRSKAGIDEFRGWFSKYIDDNKFRTVDILTFNNDMKEKFGFEFYPYLHDWFNNREQPGFLFSSLQAGQVVVDDMTKYLVSFIASNPEPVAGIFNISFRTGGKGPGEEMSGTVRSGPGSVTYSISMQGRGMEAGDISKIVILGPRESKKINIILDYEPRALLVNTLFSKNIPGEINLPIEEIKKSRDMSSLSEGEELLPSTPESSFPGEIIADNEDPGFDDGNVEIQSRLKKILGIKKRSGTEYDNINMFWAPEYWQPVVMWSYYGKYIRSAVYTRASREQRKIAWKVKIDKPGFYDIYCYIGMTGNRMTINRGSAAPMPPPGPEGNRDGENVFKDLHYTIYHDEGADEVTLEYENAEPGWNMLGRYYISSDSAKIELSNKSTGKMVIGDAVKWVKVN